MKTQQTLGFMERGCAAVAAHHNTVKNQMDAFRNQMGMLMDDDDEEDDGVNVFSVGDDEDDVPLKSNKSKPPSKYLEDEDEDDEHPDDDDDFPVFLNEGKTKAGLAEVERLGGATEDEAAENAERVIEDMKAISQYPHSDTPEDNRPDDILEMLKELDEKIDEIEQENDD
jgi:hypothetical protein